SSPGTWASEEDRLPPPLADALAALPDHDALLAAAIGRGGVVLGVAGRPRRQAAAPGPRPPPRTRGGGPRPRRPAHPPARRGSLPKLDAVAAGHGMLSVDKSADGRLRRLPMLSAIGGDYVVPSLALEMLRLAARADRVDIDADGGGVRDVAVDGLSVPTDPDGF